MPQWAGARSDELLADKSLLDREILNEAVAGLAVQGVAVRSVGVKDVILPWRDEDHPEPGGGGGEARTGQPDRQRREETAAMRSMLNTARLMEENPVLMRLKELETLEKVTRRSTS